MSEKQTENKIDEIFRKGIEPLNTEPSDDFWRKSAENIIQNGIKSNNKNASRWKAVAFILGAGLLLLGFFTYRMQSGNNKVNPEIADVKTTDTKNINVLSPVSKNDNQTDKVITISNQTAGNQKLVGQSNPGNYKIKGSNTVLTNHSIKPIAKGTGNTQVATSFVSGQSAANESNNPANNKIAGNSNNDQATLPAKNQENTPSEPEVSKNDLNTSVTVTTQIATKSTDAINTTKQNVTNHPLSITPADSIKNLHYFDTTGVLRQSALSLSIYFSPDILTGYTFKSGNNQDETAIKTGEKQQFSYSTGITAEYEFSNNFSIGLGLAYQSFSFQIAPEYLYAQKQSDGQIGYSIVSSSGIIDCPNYGNTHIGDSMKMSATSSRSYLSIPVQLKYFITNSNRMQLFIDGGIGINISTNAQTQMSWQTYQAYGVSTITTIEGLQPVYYSYFVGLGASYKTGRQVAIYIEPDLQGSITAINKNTPVISYPFLLGLKAGITYHF
jgi:hypothetical protein